jgi:hypothetical protein
MRTLTAAHEVLYRLANYSVHGRVKVEDADGTMRNLASFKGRNWIRSIEWGDDVDNQVMDATFEVQRQVYDDSIAPLYETSRLNLDAGGAYDPLLALGRDVEIEVAVVANGRTPLTAEWVLMFEGRIIDIDWAAEGEAVKVTCADHGSLLQDTMIETCDRYSGAVGEPLEDVFQDILDDHATAPAPTLYTPTSPGWNVTQFQLEIQSVMDELQMLADMIGWLCRYKWRESAGEFQLTLYTVDRSNTTPDRELTAAEYYSIDEARVSIDDIRNAIDVKFPHSYTDASGWSYTTVSVTDATSITAHGRRWMSVTEASTSVIDTSTEATDMANAILSDLKDPLVSQTVSAPFLHYVECGDLYRFTANGVTHTSDMDLSVVGYRHRIDADGGSTQLVCSGSTPKGGSKRWIEKEAAPGAGAMTSDQVMGLADAPVVESVPGGLKATVNLPRWYGKGFEIEWHAAVAGFTPDPADGSTTFVTRGREASLTLTADDSRFPVGEGLEIAACIVDSRGYRSTFSDAAGTPKRYGTQYLSESTRLATNTWGTFDNISRGADYAPDGWSMVVGAWATDADRV